MHIRIRNVRGLQEVSLPLRPGLTLAAGMNGAGKTTLLECIAAAALGDWKIRSTRIKGDTTALVRRGQETASILLEHLDSSTRISFPDARVDRKGPALDYGSALGIGAVRFMALSAEERGRELARRFETDPTRQDFDSWWRTHQAAGIDPDAPPGSPMRHSVDLLWSDIQVSGWDAIAKRMQSATRNLTGQWKEATGVNWGDKLRLTWAPEGLHRDEKYSLDAASAEVDRAEAAFEIVLRKDAVDAAERATAAEEAAKLPDLQAQHAVIREQLAASNAEAERIVGELEEVGEPVDPRQHPTCPECFKQVRVIRSPSAGFALEKVGRKALSVPAYEEALKIRGALEIRLETERQQQRQIERDAAVLGVAIQQAERAQATLAQFEGRPDSNPEEIVTARRAVEQAKARVAAIRTLERARTINAEWERGQAIVEGLVPSGIRALVLERKLSEINAALAALSQAGGMHEVGITIEGDLTYDGLRYDQLSESEKWRCDLVMSLLLAQREGARLLLVDRLDILHPQAREGVLRLLAQQEGHAVVTMTARAMDPRFVPDVDTHKLGHACWIGGGVLVED